MASKQTYVSSGERSQLLLAHPQTLIVPHCQTWIPQQFIYPERWRCDYHIISLLMLTLLLLAAHAQQLLCDDSLLCNNPSATSLQPGVPLQPVPPPLQINVLVMERGRCCSRHTVCSISSAVLLAPDAQQPCAIPAEGALHPSSGWQRAEQASLSAPLPLRTLGSSCCGG